MLCKNLLLICMAVFICADAEHNSGLNRAPSCDGITRNQLCPRIVFPVCGSDGLLYLNECNLCVNRLLNNADIAIVGETDCYNNPYFVLGENVSS
ncbi:probable pancreatic secretory proteinase inhibitor isoform X1 [Solea solea]|uniref:probable pancreatic secretory proteinase inhibitor isoform X1 n=1 Tax=Solea solea TaxID=90069 RepID=UPI00272BEB6E|nr:probable pancreatic secretory proteinase inhibitor isoform X1 [Solea solea]